MTQIRRQRAAQLTGGGANVLGGQRSLSECGLQFLQVIQTQLDRVSGSPRSPSRLWGSCLG